MLNLAEYRTKSDRLADHLPWAALVAPGIVLNKDGSFQRTLRFRGPDLESATEAELVGTCARLNNVLRRFDSGWALFFEAERFEAPGYPVSAFPDATSWLVDEERRASFGHKPAESDVLAPADDNSPTTKGDYGPDNANIRTATGHKRSANGNGRAAPHGSSAANDNVRLDTDDSQAANDNGAAHRQQRRHRAVGTQAHYESAYYLTLFYMPPADQVARAEQALLERAEPNKGRDWHQDLSAFIAETERVLDLLSGFMPEVRALDDGQTLTYLHGTVSPRRHKVAVPTTPLYLDAILADTPLSGGIEPMLGDQHLRTVTVLGFPNLTQPGILDPLNHQDFCYRWVTRFIALDKTEATKTLTRLRRQWFNKRKSIASLLREVLYNQPVPLLDSDADNKVADADLALQALGGDHVSFGYLTTTITVMDTDRLRADQKRRAVERIVNGAGFTCIRESINAVEAWLGSLPGHAYANIRQPIVHTLNLAHLVPLSSVWAGPERNDHLGGPPLFHAETSGSTPFRFSTHVGDVGHMLIVGPTGAGKSVLLALLALQFRRYAGAKLYILTRGFPRAPRCSPWVASITRWVRGARWPFSRYAASTTQWSVAGRPNGSAACSPTRRSMSRPRSRRRSGRR